MEPRYMLQGKLSGKLMRELAGGDEHRLWRLFCVSPGEGEGEFVHAILARHGLHTFVVPGLRNLIGVNTKVIVHVSMPLELFNFASCSKKQFPPYGNWRRNTQESH
jgi:hypothetical protein